MDPLISQAEDGWRTALALCGSTDAARETLIAAATSFRDITRAAAARFEARLVEESRSRRADGAPAGWPTGAARLWDAARRLPETDFEAWVLAAGRGLAPQHLALVFDLPEGFLQQGLRTSEHALRERLGAEFDEASRAMRDHIKRADASQGVEALTRASHLAARRQRRWAAIKLCAFLAWVAIVSYTLLDLMHWNRAGKEPHARAPESPLSVPKPSADHAP